VSGGDALGDEMDAPDRDPLALDQGTADRLLAGTLDPADAPPAYAGVAKVLAAAAAPPRADELAGEAEALARFAARGPAAPSGGRTRRRRPARVAVATAAVLAVLSISGAVAASDVLPQTGAWLGRAVDSMVGSGRNANTPTAVTPPTASTTAASVPSRREPGRGPIPSATTGRGNGAATPQAGLCTAWRAGKPKNMDAAAFQALAAAAGGADNIPAYCNALQTGNGNGKRDDRPENPGKGQGPGNQPGQERQHGEN